MHNRDLIWGTKSGDSIAIKDMSNSHLTNSVRYIESNIEKYNQTFGDKKVKEYLYSFKQEIRFRKLNKLKESDEDELF